jgi:hypothetical protein
MCRVVLNAIMWYNVTSRPRVFGGNKQLRVVEEI